ncbi:hypothetical protein QQF64_035856 [Cirrhinus molitorella]|uniref:Protein kinase domain-containing protein n=1 Tax=Cirrhinus molitorella TaxID=172907 RepID=A0ABR3NHR0_9TELE
MRCLAPDPAERATMEEILRHDWFQQEQMSTVAQESEEREGRKEMEELDQLDCLIKELQDIDSQVDHQDVTILSTSQTLCVENIKHTTWRSHILCCFITVHQKDDYRRVTRIVLVCTSVRAHL